MTEPRIVTPQEARLALAEAMRGAAWSPFAEALLHTVATEHDRTRAAVENAMQAADLLLGDMAKALKRQKADEEHYRYHESDRLAAAEAKAWREVDNRIRAAVAKALRHEADGSLDPHVRYGLNLRADAIENGADYA